MRASWRPAVVESPALFAGPAQEAARSLLVTSRTPLRVSLFGSGTDYPA